MAPGWGQLPHGEHGRCAGRPSVGRSGPQGWAGCSVGTESLFFACGLVGAWGPGEPGWALSAPVSAAPAPAAAPAALLPAAELVHDEEDPEMHQVVAVGNGQVGRSARLARRAGLPPGTWPGGCWGIRPLWLSPWPGARLSGTRALGPGNPSVASRPSDSCDPPVRAHSGRSRSPPPALPAPRPQLPSGPPDLLPPPPVPSLRGSCGHPSRPAQADGSGLPLGQSVGSMGPRDTPLGCGSSLPERALQQGRPRGRVRGRPRGVGERGGGDRPGPLPGAPRAAGPWRPPGAEAGARPSSVVLLLALHLSVFTMFGMLLFTGEEVLAALGAPARRGGPGPVPQGELCRGALGQRRWGQAGRLPASDQGQRRPAGSLVSFFKWPVSCRTRQAPVSPGLSLHPSRTGSLRLVLEVFGVTPPPVHLPRQAPLTTSLVSSRGLCPLRLAPPSSPSLLPSPRQLAAVRMGLPPVTRPSVPALASPPRAAMVLRVSCPGRGHRPRV